MQIQELLKQAQPPSVDDVKQYLSSLSPKTLISMGAIAGLVSYWYATRPKAQKLPCDLRQQSVPVKGEEFARRSALIGDKLLTYYFEDAKTLYEVLLRGLRVSNNGPCLGSRKPKQPYEWISYSEVVERAEALGSAFIHRGHSKTQDPHIGIFAQNRPEWTICELACYMYSLVSVPLYDTLGAEAIDYIIDKGGELLSRSVCPYYAHSVLDCVSARQHSVRTIVMMESFDSDLAARAQACGIQILTLKDMEVAGTMTLLFSPLPLLCLGNPKGAMLTHENVVCNSSSYIKMTESCCPLNSSDIHISYLPLAHMFERIVQVVMLSHGGRIGYFQGDIRFLSDDLITLKPTIFPVVPRLLNRMYDKILGQANTPLKRWLLDFAARRKQAEMNRGIVRRNSIWDQLIFRKVQASVGGSVKVMLTGAAPVSGTVLTFLRAALGCQFLEGYGQTECTAGCTVTLSGDWSAGHVGAPMPCNAVKLVDVAEMNYLAANGEGEVCVKGPNVFKGYLKDPEKTAEAIDENGWLHTGDIGKWQPNGTLKIVDRKKHIFKLAQGEYIAPEKIENIYIRSDLVAQAFVHGDSLQACLVAIIVPDPDTLPAWAKKRGLPGSFQELCRNQDVKKVILEDIVRLGKEGGLKSFEQVKDVALHSEMFSVQNGLLTPTFKAKRADLRNAFRQQIDELYSDIKM
uniref:Arachidonate--CoA ligase n=1 Tax=Denticeps clupeoides TaxID=299321 RepID=A0AAY4D4J5_9TELE